MSLENGFYCVEDCTAQDKEEISLKLRWKSSEQKTKLYVNISFYYFNWKKYYKN